VRPGTGVCGECFDSFRSSLDYSLPAIRYPLLATRYSLLRGMISPSLNTYLLISVALFAIGLLGVLIRRNTLIVFMCLELMLVASTLALVTFSRFNGTMDGNVFVFFILTVAAAEVAVGLAIIVALFRKRQTIQVDQLNTLKN
jgi:NADH-quinone oxidoreductase subunit K